MTTKRIDNKFTELKSQNRAGLVTYMMGFDPDYETSLDVLKGMPAAGADIIELGMPFSDPMADGPTIQLAGNRALAAGGSTRGVINMVAAFRKADDLTPVILMGYFNPVLHYGCEKYVADAVAAGVDGVILVDLTPEEENQFTQYSKPAGLSLIKLTAPTTDEARAKIVLNDASGFVYYISVAGITGGKAAGIASIEKSLTRLRKVTDVPIAVGFGIKSATQAKEIGAIADAVVVGSAFVNIINDHMDDKAAIAPAVHALVRELADALK
jgi:tryptophan synthase alpha chain